MKCGAHKLPHLLFIIAVSFFLSFKGHCEDSQFLSEAQRHLKKIHKLSEQDKDFDVEKTYDLAQEVLVKVEDETLSKEKRSRYLNLYAGLIGLYAKAEWDQDEGRNAFKANRKALTIFPCNTQAAMGFAQSLISVDESFWSHFAKKSLGISGDKFINEVHLAIEYLEMQEQRKHHKRIEKLKGKLKGI